MLLHLAAHAAPAPDSAAVVRARIDSLQATLRYQTGQIALPGGVATLTVPAGFRYLDSAQSRRVLTSFWGNPDGESLGMLFPAKKGPLDDDSWAFVVTYEPMGYVKDDEAADLDYDDLLKDMQSDTEEGNAARTAAGYAPIRLIGWAAAPYYDKTKNALHWAKELQFGTDDEHTLNYDLRLLGRRGVLSLNAVGVPAQLAQVRGSIPAVINGVSFAAGMRYADFRPDLDEVAAYGIGGLIAGKVLAKIGFFAIILKFWKLGLVALAGAWQAIKRFFGGRTKDDEAPTPQLDA